MPRRFDRVNLASMKFTTILLLSASCQALAAPKTLNLGQEIHAREGRAREYDLVSSNPSHADFQFKIDDQPKVVGGQIQLSGTLTNTSSSKSSVFFVSEMNAIKLEFEGVKPRTTAPKKPSSAMYALDVPAKTSVRFTGVQNLDELDYQGAPDTKLKWTFQFWSLPRPAGEIAFRLPSAVEAKVAPLKLLIQKYTGPADSNETAKFVAAVQNVSSETQKVCATAIAWELQAQDGGRLTPQSIGAPNKKECFDLVKEGMKELDSANVKKTLDTYKFESSTASYENLQHGNFMVHVTVTTAGAPLEVTSPASIP